VKTAAIRIAEIYSTTAPTLRPTPETFPSAPGRVAASARKPAVTALLGDRNVMTAAASCVPGAKVVAARGSSWFSRNRASFVW
jgi:hypothetical protein